MIKLYAHYHSKPEMNSELTLFKEAGRIGFEELFKGFSLDWPPDELILKVGKRRWYEFTDLRGEEINLCD